MVKITCNACGRRYDYAKEGLCPNCGAYNRPPRRETVDADGVVHHLDIGEEIVPPQGKVCYEEKECHEDAVRKARSPKSGGNRKVSFPYEKITAKVSDYSRKKKNARMVAMGAVLLSVVTTLIGNLAAKSETVLPEPQDTWQDTEQAVEVYERSVETADGTFAVVGWEIAGKALTVHYTADFNPMQDGEVFVECVEEDGDHEIMLFRKSNYTGGVYNSGGIMTFEADTKNFKPLTLCLEYKNETFWIDL